MCVGFWLPFRPDGEHSVHFAPRQTPQECRFSHLWQIRRHNGLNSGCLYKFDRNFLFSEKSNEFPHTLGSARSYLKLSPRQFAASRTGANSRHSIGRAFGRRIPSRAPSLPSAIAPNAPNAPRAASAATECCTSLSSLCFTKRLPGNGCSSSANAQSKAGASWGSVLTLLSGICSQTRTFNIKGLRLARLHQLRANTGVQLRSFAHLADVIEGVDFGYGIKPLNQDQAAA